jgi:phenylacetate-CoA ligase
VGHPPADRGLEGVRGRGTVAGGQAEHVRRLRWPAERLAAERRDRLAGIDPDGFEEADLAGLPPMTKDDLMANWDQVVTDRRLRHDLIEDHLAGLRSDAYVFDEFHAVASGGSTGRRGIFAFGWRAWATAYAGFLRPTV